MATGADRRPPRSSGGLRPRHFLILALLVPPALAVRQLFGPNALPWFGGWLGAMSLVTALLLGWDKKQARAQGQREPEAQLHACEMLGGWPGSFLGQRLFRHKTAKTRYQVIFWLIVAIHQFVAIDALRGWTLVRALLGR